MTEDDDGTFGPTGEVSPYNSMAVRGRDEIWNEASLPVTSWETAAYRVVLPEALQRAMGVPEPVARWAEAKRAAVLAVHRRDESVVAALAHHLNAWRYVGQENGRDATWCVVFQVDGRWHSATISRDAGGSLNIVTVFGSNKRRFVENRLKRMNTVLED